MIDLSIIIVNYNTRDLLMNCLKSIREASANLNMEVIVVDNGSTDGSIEEVKSQKSKVKNMVRQAHHPEQSRRTIQNLKIIENRKNLGYAVANNLGIKVSRGKYILLLNSDTLVGKNTLSEMIQFMEKNSQIGVATCKVELPNGQIDPACHRGFPTPWAALTYFLGLEKLFPKSKTFGQYHLGFMDMSQTHEIDSISGAFYLIRRKVIEKVGLLDKDYFMYGEDLDWSYRIKKAGFKIMYHPDVKIVHFKKQSGRNNEDKNLRQQTQKYFYETMEIFYRKHFEKKYLAINNMLIIALLRIIKFIKTV